MVLNIDANFWGKVTWAIKSDMRNLANFRQSMFESLKIWTCIGSFIQSRKSMSLKFTAGAMCHDNEEWCKIWTEADWSVQNWHDIFYDIWLQYSKISIICTLMGSFWPKHTVFEFRKYGGVMFDGTQV